MELINKRNGLSESDKSSLKPSVMGRILGKDLSLFAPVTYKMGVIKSHRVLIKIICKTPGSIVSDKPLPLQNKRGSYLIYYTNIRKYHIHFWSLESRISASQIHSLKPVAYYGYCR